MSRRILRFSVAAALTAAAAGLHAQQAPAPQSAAALARPHRVTYGAKADVEVLPVQGNIYMIAGAGSNITVSVGPSEILLIDSNEAAMSDKVLAAIRTISKLPIRSVINTSADPDHIGGNERMANSAGDNVSAFVQQGARVYAHEAAYARMTNPKEGSAIPVALWPTDAFAVPLKSFYNGEPIEVIHQPAAHSDGDLMVFFRKSDVVSAGDIFVTNGYPVLDPRRGGSLQGLIEGLNHLIDIAVPEFNSMGGTRIIPGHGRIANETDVVEYREALVIIADRVTQMVLEGKTLEQVKAANVTLDYDGVYGSTTGPWTTDMFLAEVYREIKADTPAWRARLMRNVPADELPSLTTANRPATRPGARPSPAAAAAKKSSDPLDGKWAMDVFTSKYTPVGLSPYRREMTITFAGDEMTHYTATWRRQGNASPLTSVTYKAKFDGKEYPVPLTPSKVTLTRPDPNTVQRTIVGTDGSKETSAWKLSADGKTLTIDASGVDPTGVMFSSTQIYTRQ